jgi:hypothetical protein
MDMSEQVQQRTNTPHGQEQVLATHAGRVARLVPDTEGRVVRDQHVRIRGDERPLACQRLPAREIEGPVVVSRLPRTPPELDAVNGRPGVLKIGYVGSQDIERRLTIPLKAPVVIARDDKFMPVR